MSYPAEAAESAAGAPESEIEITPAMIEAGAIAWGQFDAGDRLDWTLAEVYRAMEAARLGGRAPAPNQRRLPREIAAYLSLRS